MLLFCNIDADAGFELDREVVGENGNLLDEPLDLILVKVRDAGFLLIDEILQLLDPVHGFFPAVAVHLGFFFLFPEPENPIGNGVVVLFAVGLLDKFLLEFYQPCLNGVSCEAFYSMDDALSATISAGHKAKGTVAFEVPDDAKVVEVEYLTNVWTSNRIVFDCSKAG